MIIKQNKIYRQDQSIPNNFAYLFENEIADAQAAVDTLGLDGWSTHFTSSTAKLGYSGVAILCRTATVGAPISVQYGIGNEAHDREGRVVTVELPRLWVVNVYVPNSGAAPQVQCCRFSRCIA